MAEHVQPVFDIVGREKSCNAVRMENGLILILVVRFFKNKKHLKNKMKNPQGLVGGFSANLES
jgi:hypothetical protein